MCSKLRQMLGPNNHPARKMFYLLTAATAAYFTFYFLVATWVPPARSSMTVGAASLGVYWGPGLTESVDSIDWGALEPGTSKKIDVYVRNGSDRAVELSYETSGWVPSMASGFISIGWNCTDEPLNPLGVMKTALTLTVSSEISDVTDFSFNIVLVAESSACTINQFCTLFSDATGVTMIYPSDCPVKPLGTKAAMVSDWLASSYIYTKLEDAIEVLDTNTDAVDQGTGRIVADTCTRVISFGGPFVNPVVKYAESPSTPEPDRAPIMFRGDDEHFFQLRDGEAIPGASLPASVINTDQDMFVMEVYEDGDGRVLMICYGFGWKGTYATGKYFETVVYPDLDSQPYGWIIVKWEDANGNGFVNTKSGGDTYTLVASGP